MIDAMPTVTRRHRPARPARRLKIRVGGRNAWVGVHRLDQAVVWTPVPFLALRWDGDARMPGVVLVLTGLLSQVLQPPRPWGWLLVLWLVWPGACALWWSWRDSDGQWP